MSTSWEQLRRETRAIESAVEEKLSYYASLNSAIAASKDVDLENPPADGSETIVAAEIESLLATLSENIDRMNAIASASSNTSQAALLQRYREIYFDYNNDFKRTSSSIQQKKESAQLFKRNTGFSSERNSIEDSQMEYLLRERNAIDSSSRMADSIIGQAMETKSSLEKQRDRISNSHGKIGGLTDAFAGINGIVEQIRRKRLRNNTIIALVVAACICLIIILKF